MPQTYSEKEIKMGEMDIDLDKQVRNQLLEDRVKADEAIKKIITTKRNFTVVKEHYLAPTIMNKSLDIEDENGEFKYFSRIRQAIEYALIKETIPKRIKLPFHIPEYLSELIE